MRIRSKSGKIEIYSLKNHWKVIYNGKGGKRELVLKKDMNGLEIITDPILLSIRLMGGIDKEVIREIKREYGTDRRLKKFLSTIEVPIVTRRESQTA